MNEPKSNPPQATIEVASDPTALAALAGEHLVRCAAEAIAARRAFHLALSGGSTPKPLYRLLGGALRERIDWSRVHLWFGDERCVPPSHEASNFHMVQETLLDALALPDAQLHRIRGEATDRVAEAARYADELLHRLPVHQGVPVFDLMLQGMGGDGHTASLFPTTGKALVRDRAVVHVVPPAYVSPAVDRISVTAPVIQGAREVHVLVAGDEKAQVLEQVIHGPVELDVRPSGLVRGARGTVRWLLDAAAASKLSAR